MEDRPRYTPEIGLAAARETVEELQKAGLLEKDDDLERCAADLAKHGRQHMDGYEIAKALDSYCHWDCNLDMAQILDGFGWAATQLVVEAQKAWAEKNAIQPPLPIGTHVKIKSGELGTLDEVYKYGAAQYCVKLDKDLKAEPPTNSRRIVNFEDCVAA